MRKADKRERRKGRKEEGRKEEGKKEKAELTCISIYILPSIHPLVHFFTPSFLLFIRSEIKEYVKDYMKD